MWINSICRSTHQARKCRLVSSGPLSQRIAKGCPRSLTIASNTRVTLRLAKLVSTGLHSLFYETEFSQQHHCTCVCDEVSYLQPEDLSRILLKEAAENVTTSFRSTLADSPSCKNTLVKENLVLRALEVIGRQNLLKSTECLAAKQLPSRVRSDNNPDSAVIVDN